MTIQNLGNLEVQYISCYFTRKMKVLFGDRRSRMNPILTVFSDDVRREINLVISNVRVDEQRRANVKEGLDLYLIKSEVTKLKQMLHSILHSVATTVRLDSTLRQSRDPRSTYDVLTSGGLVIPIQILEGWVKVNEVRAVYGSEGFLGKVYRSSINSNNPSINIEKEDKPFWDEPRMHIGIHEDWIEEEITRGIGEEIVITIPWEELGHLYGKTTAVEARL
ncbi:hypothetical protein ACQUY5_09720 [Bacillus cereus]|uniref:hypothetical protein n=1 Tax=Bacillus cereus TaxID=1396 RepID=UPI003D16A3A7